MTFRFRPVLALVAATAVLSVCHAAEDDDDDDSEFNSLGFFSHSPQSVRFGVRVSQGPQVRFGHVGEVPVPTTYNEIPLAAGVTTRKYMDGTVTQDSPRGNEVDANGVQLSHPGTRYKVYSPDGSGTLQGDYLAYTPGQTRAWSMNDPSQVSGGVVNFNYYSAVSQGAEFSGKRKIGGGVQLDVTRTFTKPGHRVQFSLLGGVSLNGIHSSASGSVKSTLHVYTDSYSLNGAAAPTPSGGTYPLTEPVYQTLTTVNPADGTSASVTNGLEVTTPLVNETDPSKSAHPVTHSEKDVANGADVTGVWKIKGAYYSLRLGPQVSFVVTPSISLNAGAGVAGAYAGTTYSAYESFKAVGVTDAIVYDSETQQVSSEKAKFLGGYFASVDANWSLNDRTGLFAGVDYEALGSYDQTLSGRTAKIDLGNSLGFRGGLAIKF